ncbi:methyltransferase domain-containing protein [Pseudomonadota bacterium]
MNVEDQWLSSILESYNNPPVFYRGAKLPSFPPDELQINTTGQAGYPTLKEAFVFYSDCIEAFSECGLEVNRHRKVLDFGVGWGRIARFFLEQIPKENIFGIDVTQDFVDVCKETFDSQNFSVCAAFPPTELEDNSFDYIVAYSVFSHLSESACRQWMEEFHRILKPGGMVAVTTRGRPFFDYCESLKIGNPEGYSAALSQMFDDFDEARQRYDRGEFVHSSADGVTGGGAMNSSFYGESFIPKQYAESAYEQKFRLKKFLFSPPRQTHPIIFYQSEKMSSTKD